MAKYNISKAEFLGPKGNCFEMSLYLNNNSKPKGSRFTIIMQDKKDKKTKSLDFCANFPNFVAICQTNVSSKDGAS